MSNEIFTDEQRKQMFEDEQIMLTIKAGPDSGIGKLSFEVALDVKEAKALIEQFLLKKTVIDDEPKFMTLPQRKKLALQMAANGADEQEISDAVGASTASVRKYLNEG